MVENNLFHIRFPDYQKLFKRVNLFEKTPVLIENRPFLSKKPNLIAQIADVIRRMGLVQLFDHTKSNF